MLSSPAQAHHPSYSNCCCFDASGNPSERLQPFAPLLLLHSEHRKAQAQRCTMGLCLCHSPGHEYSKYLKTDIDAVSERTRAGANWLNRVNA